MTGSSSDTVDSVRLEIEGMHCSSCVGHVEDALKSVDGVDGAVVSLADATAQVSGRAIDEVSLVQAVKSAGYAASPLASERSLAEERGDLERRTAVRAIRWRLRVIVGFVVWIPLAIVHWFGGAFGLPMDTSLVHWCIAGVSTVAFLYVGSAFFTSAWQALLVRTANMDTLVSIGAISAYVFSLAELIRETVGVHQGTLYFVEASGLLAFISLGHWIEARTTAAAGGALRSLLELQPDEVVRLSSATDSTGETVTSASIRPGDLIQVKPGNRVAVDGEILEGRSAMDESAVTGEPLPVDRSPGDQVTAGTVSTNGLLVVRTTTDGNTTTISRIAEIVRSAQASKTKIQKLADRIAGIFVPIVLVIAAVTFGSWWIFGNEDALVHAVVNMVTVLVIACPCALGLATPTAVMAGSGAASSKGILVRSAEAMERTAVIGRVCFDKTGTLTVGRPTVESGEDEVIRRAAALSIGSAHPLSEAIVTAASDRGLEVPSASDITEIPGRGLTARIGNAKIELQSASAAIAEGTIGQDMVAPGRTCSVLLEDGAFIGTITFTDKVRDDAAELIKELHARNIVAMLLTGDRRSVAEELASRIGLSQEEIHADLLPEQKVQVITSSPVTVAMVGDGINDAGALAEAGARGGVGIAIGTGTNIAIESADVVIPADRLLSVIDTIRISRATRRTIRQNLALSFLYNTCAIPVAAIGLLGSIGPLIAGIAMGLSSVSVVANSLRLRLQLNSPRRDH